MLFGIPGSYSKKGGGLSALLAPLFNLTRQQQEQEEQPAMLSSLMQQYDQDEDEMQTPVFDQYLELLQNQPRREDFQPSLGRKILGGLAGAMTGFTSGAQAGTRAVQDITEGPFRNAQRDFQAEIEPLEKGVGFEKAFGETLRKRTADRRGFGVKLAKLEGDFQEAMGKLDVAERRATTEEERTRILAAKNNLQAEYQRERLKVDRLNAGANQTRANASMVSAKARERNSQTYGSNSSRRPQHVPVTEQLRAEAVGSREALDEVLSMMPSVQGVKLGEDGKLVFPKDMVPQVQEKFQQIFNDTKAKKAQDRLSRTR